MKNAISRKSMLLLILVAAMTFAGNAVVPEHAHVDQLSALWRFKSISTPQSVLTKQVAEATFSGPASGTDGFTLKFVVDLKKFVRDQDILEIPSIVNVRLRQHDVKERNHQNYPAYKMQDGTVPVLEASIALQSQSDKADKQDMTIGVPLAMLDNPEGEHEVILNFSGVYWTMYVDGKLVDNDFPIGYPAWKPANSWKMNTEYVSKAEISLPAITPERVQEAKPEVAPAIQYWTPRWHNAWVGDVVTFFNEGRYHVFYLFDRRGHESKFGRGGHYFEHLSTTDFITWTEHEAATPIEEQWETIGTGTPFLYNGKFCLSYGLHTTRIYPKEETALPEQWKYLEENGHTAAFSCDTLSRIPAGSTYSISEDGVSKFRKTHILFHPCENPSIYTDPDNGQLKMLANYGSKGTWESTTVDSGWHCTNPTFPLGGDCTFFFRWGRYDYILGGFSKLWSKPADATDAAYEDVVSKGLEFYNGLSVPAITEIAGGRFLMAGWLKMRRWGGPLAIYELVQYPDGRVGTKWMEEIVPATGKFTNLSKTLSGAETFASPGESYMLTFDVIPSKSSSNKLGVVFMSDEGEEHACELQITPDDKRAQFGAGSVSRFAAPEKSLREGGDPQGAYNYAIENLVGVDKPFTVRLIVKGSDKYGGSIVDAEIAGQRTMVTYRPDLFAKKVLFRPEGLKLKNVKIAPLK